MGEEIKNKEIRSNAMPPGLHISEDGSGRTISGYALVFESESEPLYDNSRASVFTEVISRAAVTDELIRASDVRALLEHDTGRLLARSRAGGGTLRLTADEVGLRYEFEAPNTPDGDTVVELVRRGDFAGSSFAFTCGKKDCEWSTRADGTAVRRVNRISGIYDVSVVSNPAYSKTSVSVRTAAPPAEEVAAETTDPRVDEYRQRIKTA